MLTGNRSTGVYEFIVLLLMTGLGFFGAPWWVVPIAALALVCLAVSEHAGLRPRLRAGGAMTVAGSATLAFALTAVAFAGFSYAGGYALSAIIHG
jgi:hypothetical protein